MKICLTLLALFLLLFPARARQDFTIEGRVTGVEPGAVVSYAVVMGKMSRSAHKDNDTLSADGRFHFVYPLDSAQRFTVRCAVGEVGMTLPGLDIWGEPGQTVVVTGEGPYAKMWHAESGHPEQRLMNRLNEASRPDHARVWQNRLAAEQTRDTLALDSLLREWEQVLSPAIFRRSLDLLAREEVSDLWLDQLHSAAMPEMRELTGKRSDVLTIVGMNMDTSDQSWKLSVDNWGPVTWQNLNAPVGSDLEARYGVSAYPTLLLISPEGTILEKWVGYRPGEIEKLLEKHRK